ncbi:30S ribosomal protein S11 [Candidatus Parcubacteria bacterium]|nr:30S ribosomal protein S11 [Candidatus Parcubacteria bacterium]
MGKKRIVKTSETEASEGAPKAAVAAARPNDTVGQAPTGAKKRFELAGLYIQSTYNNTKAVLTDPHGNALAWSSSGSLGFKGAKKGTPFAAAKVGELLGTKAQTMGVKEVAVVVNGVGSGRESLIRGFISKSIGISSIKDVTSVPHNGPKPKKPRRV